jgi:hypothetical protein
MYHIFLIYSLVVGHLGYFHSLTIVINLFDDVYCHIEKTHMARNRAQPEPTDYKGLKLAIIHVIFFLSQLFR